MELRRYCVIWEIDVRYAVERRRPQRNFEREVDGRIGYCNKLTVVRDRHNVIESAGVHRHTRDSVSLDERDFCRPNRDGVVGVPISSTADFDLLADERKQFGVVVFRVVADEFEEAVPIGQQAERLAFLRAIDRARHVAGARAFGDTLFAIARHVDDLALENDLLSGREQRRRGEEQCGGQQPQVSVHRQTSTSL